MSIAHLLIVLVIVLVLFGPSRLEGIGISLGRAIRGFKKGMEGEETPTEAASKKRDDDTTPKA
jgi:sec-independent protein translocase protein TatA